MSSPPPLPSRLSTLHSRAFSPLKILDVVTFTITTLSHSHPSFFSEGNPIRTGCKTDDGVIISSNERECNNPSVRPDNVTDERVQ